MTISLEKVLSLEKEIAKFELARDYLFRVVLSLFTNARIPIIESDSKSRLISIPIINESSGLYVLNKSGFREKDKGHYNRNGYGHIEVNRDLKKISFRILSSNLEHYQRFKNHNTFANALGKNGKQTLWSPEDYFKLLGIINTKCSPICENLLYFYDEHGRKKYVSLYPDKYGIMVSTRPKRLSYSI